MFLKNRSINPVQFFRRIKIVSKRLFYNNPSASAIKMRFLQMQRNHPVERRGRSQIKQQIIRFFLIGNLLQTFPKPHIPRFYSRINRQIIEMLCKTIHQFFILFVGFHKLFQLCINISPVISIRVNGTPHSYYRKTSF